MCLWTISRPRPFRPEGAILAAGTTSHQWELVVVRPSYAWGADLAAWGLGTCVSPRCAVERCVWARASGVVAGNACAWCLTRRMLRSRVRVGVRSQVSKSNAQTLTNAALDGLKAASSEIRAKIEVLKPLQERLSSTQKEVRSRAAHPPWLHAKLATDAVGGREGI